MGQLALFDVEEYNGDMEEQEQKWNDILFNNPYTEDGILMGQLALFDVEEYNGDMEEQEQKWNDILFNNHFSEDD